MGYSPLQTLINTYTNTRTVFVSTILALLFTTTVLAETPTSLQGVWTNSSVTDLERPEGMSKLVLTEAEAQEMLANDGLANRLISDAQPTDPNAPLLDGSDLLAGRGYNTFWIDPGNRVGQVKGQYRSSWIVDPVDGRIPYSDEGRKIFNAAGERRNNYDGPEVRPLGERCMATTGRTGPPMINGLYNNTYQFIQTEDYVMIHTEMVSHARIIPINGKHFPPSITQQFGQPIGRWEGETLVVETTHFHPMHLLYAHPAFLRRDSKVTERFTRVSENEIFYEFTVDDPVLYSQIWRGESRFLKYDKPWYEFACHEGNYSMPGILGGARAQEK